ncbi:MAG: sensor histidine kinase [Clostridiales bacterium]|nr:sensor histidine kinase [Clostridiales bacterium]
MRLMPNTGIKYKLFMSQISLILVAVLSFFVISVSYFIVKAKNDAEVNLRYASSITVSNISNEINSMETCIYFASYNTDIASILSDEEELSVFDMWGNYNYVCRSLNLSQLNCKLPVTLTLYPTSDNIVIYDGLYTVSADTIKTAKWYRDSEKNSTKFHYFTETEDDISKFCIVNTLYNPDNLSEVVGYIKISTDLSIFRDIMQDFAMTNEESILLNNDGDIICTLSGKSYAADIAGSFINISSDKLDTLKIDRTKYFLIQSKTEDERYSTVGLQAVSSVYKDIYFMAVILLIILLLIIIISFVVSHLISGSIISSLDTLINAMKMSKLGELKTIEAPNSGNNELNDAINAYNNMVTNIENLIEYNNSHLETLKKYEFNFLQMQIKPHFLYNTLNLIQCLAKENKPDDVTALIKNLSKFYRTSLHTKGDFVKIENELEHISYYVAIENVKHDNSIKLDIDISEDIMNFSIPKITLQPIVENSIIHGILEKEQPQGTVSITAKKENDDIYIYIKDDGVGISPAKIEEIKKGETDRIGVLNTDKRLKLFFGNEYGLTIEGKENEYTLVTIKIKGVKFYDKNYDC